ncbi:MAG: MATE family efflux transporter, partial [Muribaculaceae bacterium]|nr:MATE family efflux transporter [Muribaculaceae bacterium]
MMSIMSPVREIVALGTDVLRIEAWAEPLFAASIVCYGVFVGAGDTLKPCGMTFLSMWGVRLILAALLAPTMGLKGVWIAMCIELIFRGIIFLMRLKWGNWTHLSRKRAVTAENHA